MVGELRQLLRIQKISYTKIEFKEERRNQINFHSTINKLPKKKMSPVCGLSKLQTSCAVGRLRINFFRTT